MPSPGSSCSFVSARGTGGRIYASIAQDGTVKSAHDCQDIRALEELLRDQLGLTVRASKRVAPAFWAALKKAAAEADEPEPDPELEHLAHKLATLNSSWKR